LAYRIQAIRTVERAASADIDGLMSHMMDVSMPAFMEALAAFGALETDVNEFGAGGLAGADQTESTVLTVLLVTALGAVAAAVTLGYLLSLRIADRGCDRADGPCSGRAIASGELDREITVTSADETGDMAGSFGEMTEYLREMANVAERIAVGDVDAEVRPRSADDALSHSFLRMIEQLEVLIGGASSTAKHLVDAQGQLQRSTSEVADATNGVAERTQLAATGAEQAAQASETGATMMSETVAGIGRIKESLDGAAQEISSLGERSQEIGKIVAVIEEIAAQTNLLALNGWRTRLRRLPS
jgi:methyl-accepting chemotaxis protein